MSIPTSRNLRAELADAVARYEAEANVAALHRRIDDLAEGASADALVEACEPFRQIPEVAGPVYERVVAQRPDDARALVALGNAYWLAGRGPEAVGDLAARAIAADPGERAAWHLWALSESSPRQRTARWRQVVQRFPHDDLAKALLADNAAGLAGAEHDDEALALAIATYDDLLARATRPEQRAALQTALRTLRGWKL